MEILYLWSMVPSGNEIDRPVVLAGLNSLTRVSFDLRRLKNGGFHCEKVVTMPGAAAPLLTLIGVAPSFTRGLCEAPGTATRRLEPCG